MVRRWFVAILCSVLLLGSPVRAQTAATANYVISLAGANLATVTIALRDDGRRYTLSVDANVTGLGQLVADGTAHAESAGRLSDDRLTSESFNLATRTSGETFSTRVEYAGGEVTTFVVDPPLINNIGRVPIERKHLRGVNDFLASLVLRQPELSASICDRKLPIFTGVERFDLQMRYAADDVATSPRTGYQGPVVLCRIRYVPVSGHFTTSEFTAFLAGSDRILIWYAPLGTTGYLIPYRVLITTSMGDLSMVLTRMQG